MAPKTFVDRLRAGLSRFQDPLDAGLPYLRANLGDREELREVAAMISQRMGPLTILSELQGLRIESPLEARFYLALCACVAEVFRRPHGRVIYQHEHLAPDEPHHVKLGLGDHLGVCCQHPLGAYRIDFLLTGQWSEGILAKVAVEVDGHDSHERTKEQARHDRKKDREIQAAGFKILRFTGSEVHADPVACAREAMDAAFGLDFEPDIGAD